MKKNYKFIFTYNILSSLMFIMYLVLFFINKSGFERQKLMGYIFIPILFIFIIFFNVFSILYLYKNKKNKLKNIKKYEKIYNKAYKPSPFYIFVLLITAILFTCFISFGKINGSSMENTFHNNEFYITYTFNISKNHNDFVIVKTDINETDNLIIKRLVAKKEDKLIIEKVKNEKNRYYIKVNEKYIMDIKNNQKGEFFDYEIEKLVKDIKKIDENNYIIDKDLYLIIGDNFLNSKDSRYYGLIKEKDIISKILFK